MFNYKDFYKKIEEHALYFDNVDKRFDDYLSNIKNNKLFLKQIQEEMDRFRETIKGLGNRGKFQPMFKLEDDGRYLFGEVKYNKDIEDFVNKMNRLVQRVDEENNEDLMIKLNRIIFGSDDYMNFRVSVQIDKEDFNRIHIINDLPYTFRNMGFGVSLYKTLIDRYQYLSSNYDSSLDAKFIWETISRSHKYYTSIKDKSIISFTSKKMVKDILENVLRKWLRDAENYQLDNDMVEKFGEFDIK